ncbi:hypothetical protein BY996DRAFT_1258586 [Phakopsora pachyrhizi]|nr:hypothetical protein BY996DRAFT_1258586 [Phakopsora pachyrhizi]
MRFEVYQTKGRNFIISLCFGLQLLNLSNFVRCQESPTFAIQAVCSTSSWEITGSASGTYKACTTIGSGLVRYCKPESCENKPTCESCVNPLTQARRQKVECNEAYYFYNDKKGTGTCTYHHGTRSNKYNCEGCAHPLSCTHCDITLQ